MTLDVNRLSIKDNVTANHVSSIAYGGSPTVTLVNLAASDLHILDILRIPTSDSIRLSANSVSSPTLLNASDGGWVPYAVANVSGLEYVVTAIGTAKEMRITGYGIINSETSSYTRVQFGTDSENFLWASGSYNTSLISLDSAPLIYVNNQATYGIYLAYSYFQTAACFTAHLKRLQTSRPTCEGKSLGNYVANADPAVRIHSIGFPIAENTYTHIRIINAETPLYTWSNGILIFEVKY